jgi:hypothetical protein
MAKKIKFDKSAVKKAKNEFKKVKLDEEQKEIVNNLIDIGDKYISLNKSALSYFVMESINDWQKVNSLKVQDIQKMTAEERINNVSDILQRVKQRLVNILLYLDQKEDVDKAIEEALEFYKEKYSKR